MDVLSKDENSVKSNKNRNKCFISFIYKFSMDFEVDITF